LQFDKEAAISGKRAGTASQPALVNVLGDNAIQFQAKQGDKWSESNGTIKGNNPAGYPRSEVAAENVYSRSVKYDRTYEMTGWMSFLTNPLASFLSSTVPGFENDTIQAGFQFHAQADVGSSTVSMNLHRTSGWVFVSSQSVYNITDYGASPPAGSGIAPADWISDTDPLLGIKHTINSTWKPGQPPLSTLPTGRLRPINVQQVILSWADLNALVGGIPRYQTKMRYKLEWRPTFKNDGSGYIRYSIDMNNDGIFTSDEVRVNIAGPNGYWLTNNDSTGGNPKWRYINPSDPNDTAGQLKMGLYDFASVLNAGGLTLYTSSPVLRRIQ
jgi:hypothetical protein